MESETHPEGRIVVQKYGGSSVADPEKLGRVAERVAATVRTGCRVVVVVSAMGKTTDQLLQLAREVVPDPPRRELDMLLSTGERISMALLAMALHRLGIEAISFTGSQSGILTNDRHSGARIIEVRPVRIQDELARGKVVIVAGFQGMSYKREITTLGRGGSDTTAVALAAALRAEYCEICSDVDGVYSADPRVVPEAHRLDAVGYDAMQELAEHGAKVLHAQAVEWARRADIVVHAVATSAPPVAAGGSGTRITPTPPDGARGAVAIAGSRRLVRVSLAGADSQRGAGSATSGDDGEALLALLEAEGVALRRFTLHPAPEALFSPDDVPDLGRVRLALGARFPGAHIDERGEVAAVGPGVGADPAAIRRALAAVHAVATGRPSCEATPMRLSFYLDGADVDTVTRALHAALIPSVSASGGARPVS